LITPSPFIPLPYKGGGTGYVREAKPLFNSPFSISPSKERGRIKKEGLAPLLDSHIFVFLSKKGKDNH